jgi:hypothetical protein
MVSRPTVGIVSADGSASGSTHPLPAVFSSPIRPDIVQYVACQNAAKNALTQRIDLFTLAWQRTNANPTPSVRKQESRRRPNPGELVRSISFRNLTFPSNSTPRPRCCSYSSCLWWWNPSCWSSCLRQSMSIWPHVRTYQSVAEMASKDQSWPKVRNRNPHFEASN